MRRLTLLMAVLMAGPATVAIAQSPAQAAPHTLEIAVGRFAYAVSSNDDGANTKDTKLGPGDPSPLAPAVYVGSEPGMNRVYRGFLQFPIDRLAGVKILGAKVTGTADHTYNCQSRSSYLYRSENIATTATRQTWPGPNLLTPLGTLMVHANEASCSDPNMGFEATSATLISDLQAAVDANSSGYTIAATAAGSTSGANESATDGYMRFFLNDYRLSVTYNTKPGRPDGLTVDDKPCGTGADRPAVNTTTPTLRARVRDADGDLMDTYFWWSRWDGTAFVDEPGAGAHQDSVPSDGTALMSVTSNVEGAVYAFRARSRDSYDESDMSADCEWQVDVTAPTIPTVSGDAFRVGQTGRFTFASASADTHHFLYGFADPPTSTLTPQVPGGDAQLAWTPTSSGLKTLRVRAVDRAGNESPTATYQFTVEPPAPAAARWLMNDRAGATTLADDTGNGRTATVLNGATLGTPGRLRPGNDGIARTALAFDGVDDRAQSSGRVIADTSKSFTVAAWVRLADLSINQTILSVRGTRNDVFSLAYSNTGVWRFTSTTTDAAGAALNPPLDGWAPPRLNTWTHLAVSYDLAAHAVRMHINGSTGPWKTGVTLWDGDGVLRMGGSTAPLKGSLAEVQVWDRVFTSTDASNAANPLKVSRVGDWHLDEIGPGPAYDSSGMLHDLSFFGGAQIPPSGTGLRLDGVDDHAATGEPVLHTDQSFTVSAWVRMADTGREQVILAQESNGLNPGFALSFSPANGGQWRVRMAAGASNGAADTVAYGAATNPSTTPHHLVAVFDAQNRQLKLHADNILLMSTAMNAGWSPWNANGRFLIGRSHQGTVPAGFAAADIDDVRAYQGAVTSITSIP